MVIQSPLKYQGNKRKLIDAIDALCPDCTGFLDMFGGSGVVCANINSRRDLARCVYNEYDTKVWAIIKWLVSTKPKQIRKQLYTLLDKFDMRTRDCEAGYNTLVQCINAGCRTPVAMYCVSRHAHSNLLRTNSEGKINIKFGDRYIFDRLDAVMEEIELYQEAMSEVQLRNTDYAECIETVFKQLDKHDVLYFDPPYLASGQFVYGCKWTEQSERQLLAVLDKLTKAKRKFMLSNVLAYDVHENNILLDWSKNYNVHEVGQTKYSLGHAYVKKAKTQEVIITNF